MEKNWKRAPKFPIFQISNILLKTFMNKVKQPIFTSTSTGKAPYRLRPKERKYFFLLLLGQAKGRTGQIGPLFSTIKLPWLKHFLCQKQFDIVDFRIICSKLKNFGVTYRGLNEFKSSFISKAISLGPLLKGCSYKNLFSRNFQFAIVNKWLYKHLLLSPRPN